MIWLDWLILAILAYNLIGGLMNGLLRSLVNLAALIGAYLLTPFLKPVMIGLVGSVFGLEEILAVPIGVGLTWTAIYLGISLVGSVIGKMVNKTPLKFVDRAGGAVFGLFISSILILVPLAAVQSIPLLRDMKPVQETLAKSLCMPVLSPFVTIVKTTVGPAIVDYWLKKDKDQFKSPSKQPPPPAQKAVPLQKGASGNLKSKPSSPQPKH
jgi:membrane protein required for colicin V production